MERITEDQITRLVAFVYARIPDERTLTREEARRAAALRLVTDRQIAALRHYRHSVPDARARAEVHATASWNLLVFLAHLRHATRTSPPMRRWKRSNSMPQTR